MIGRARPRHAWATQAIFRLCPNHFMRSGLQLITAMGVCHQPIRSQDYPVRPIRTLTWSLTHRVLKSMSGFRIESWTCVKMMICKWYLTEHRDTFNGARLKIEQTDGQTNNGTVNLNKTNQAQDCNPRPVWRNLSASLSPYLNIDQIWTLNILLWLRPLHYKLMPAVLQVNNWHPNTLLNAKYNDTHCSCIIHEKWQIWIELSQRWGAVTMQSTPQMAQI